MRTELGERQRREFQEVLLEVGSFSGPARKWQAAILKAEQSRSNLRVVTGD